ncbi:hypothetical protein H6F76_01970 [Leptolyngbya sp. FACHB-321]|nr:hypothetical protein [Leptolyngbya sp. FACHB-321]
MERIYNQFRQLEKQIEAESQPQPTFIFNSSQSVSQLLFDLLLQIDFKQQSQLAKETIDLHRISEFLVHGSPGYGGQQFLVTQLCRLSRKFRKVSPIKIDVAYNGVWHDSCKSEPFHQIEVNSITSTNAHFLRG